MSRARCRTITSGNVLRRVIDKLGLRNDPEFADKMRLFDLGWLFDRRASDAAERNDLMGLLAKRINVVRPGAVLCRDAVGLGERAGDVGSACEFNCHDLPRRGRSGRRRARPDAWPRG